MDLYGEWINKVLIVDTISDLPLMTRPLDSQSLSQFQIMGVWLLRPCWIFLPHSRGFFIIIIVITAHYCLGCFFYPIIAGFMKCLLAPISVWPNTNVVNIKWKYRPRPLTHRPKFDTYVWRRFMPFPFPTFFLCSFESPFPSSLASSIVLLPSFFSVSIPRVFQTVLLL